MAEMMVYHFQGQVLKDLWVLQPSLRLLAPVEVTAMRTFTQFVKNLT